jgi:hypothetical protein
MSDADALRAKANVLEKEEKLRIAMDAAVWPEKTLPTRDEELQPFIWPYGARQFIAEKKLVTDILRSSKQLNMWGNTLSFQDAFVETDTVRVELLDRLYILFNTQAKRETAQALCERGCPQPGTLQALYCVHVHSLSIAEDMLLLMQALHEELKPETRELIKICTSEKQLHMSMFSMRESPTPKKRRLIFRNESEHAAVGNRFALVDAQIAHLQSVLDGVAETLTAGRLPAP